MRTEDVTVATSGEARKAKNCQKVFRWKVKSAVAVMVAYRIFSFVYKKKYKKKKTISKLYTV